MEAIPVTERSKAWVRGRSLAEIAGSNPTGGHGSLSVVGVVCCQAVRIPPGGMEICLLWVLRVVRHRSLPRVDNS